MSGCLRSLPILWHLPVSVSTDLFSSSFSSSAKLATATEVIAENLGRSWRRLGRKLGLSEVKLESIAARHPTELEETAVEVVKEWRKIRGPGARVEDLIQALRACDFNLTAHKLELRLSECAQGHV